jgi:hypothetical protein
MVVRRLYSGNVIVKNYVVPDVKCRDIPMVVRRLYSAFNSRNYVIIDNNIARIKTPDDHWYISTFNGNVIVNDYLVPALKCRDIPMVVRRLYSGNVIVKNYVVPDI